MGFLHQFDKFDPLTNIIPVALPIYGLDAIADRARVLVKGRNKDQIVAAAEFIDLATGQFFKECETDDGLDVRAWSQDYLWGFKQCYKSYQFEGVPEFPNGKAYEYFAVLSLWLLSDSLNRLAQPNKPPISEGMRRMTAPGKSDSPELIDFKKKMWESYNVDEVTGAIRKLGSASRDAIDSMDAVCFAEHLCGIHHLEVQHELNIIKKIGEEASQKARKAANMRHAKTTHLIKRFAVDLYFKERDVFKSVKEAARIIHDDVVNYAKELNATTLSGVSAFDQIYTWLRVAEKDCRK